MRDQNRLPAGKLQRVVMCIWMVQVDLPEAGHRLAGFPARLEPKHRIAFDVLLERDFGARHKAYRDAGFSDRGKATSNRVRKFGRYQLIANFCGPGDDVMETVVAH